MEHGCTADQWHHCWQELEEGTRLQADCQGFRVTYHVPCQPAIGGMSSRHAFDVRAHCLGYGMKLQQGKWLSPCTGGTRTSGTELL